jgi:hypothetical protein
MRFHDFKNFLNESDEKVDELRDSMMMSLSEYHNAMKKLQELQTRFVKTPREKINERESLKKEIISANRDMLVKQGEFHQHLADSGDGDIFNNNDNQ